MNGVERATNNLHFYVSILTTLDLAVVADVLAFCIFLPKWALHMPTSYKKVSLLR